MGHFNNQGGREHWAVYYTRLQSFIITCSYSLAQQLGSLIKFISCFMKLNVLAFPQRICNFVYHNWGCTSIYQPLSHPFRYPGWQRFHLTPDCLKSTISRYKNFRKQVSRWAYINRNGENCYTNIQNRYLILWINQELWILLSNFDFLFSTNYFHLVVITLFIFIVDVH